MLDSEEEYNSKLAVKQSADTLLLWPKRAVEKSLSCIIEYDSYNLINEVEEFDLFYMFV